MSLSKSRTGAQYAASRANGHKSAGPKTLAGKRIASRNATKGSTATPRCARGGETPTARAIALRHMIEMPRRSDPSDHEKHKEMVRRIFEVYGLAPPEPEKNRSQVAAATEGGDPSADGEPGEGSRPHFSEKSPQDSTGPPGE